MRRLFRRGFSSKQNQHLVRSANTDDVSTWMRITSIPPGEWNKSDVQNWLHVIEMDNIRKQLNVCNGATLISLTSEKLITLGVNRLGQRKLLLNKIKLLKTSSDFAFKAGNAAPETKDDMATSSETSHSDSTTDSNRASESGIKFKATYGETTKMFSVPNPCSYKKLRRTVIRAFPNTGSIRLHWIDEDGDRILIESQDELQDVLAESSSKKAIRLSVSSKTKKHTGEFDVLEAMTDPVVLISPVGKVVFFNKAAEAFWGYKRTEVKDVKDLMPPSVAKHHDGYLSAYIQTGKTKIIGKGRVVDIRMKSGRKVSTLLSVTETITANRHTFTGVFRPAEEAETRGKSDWSSYAGLTDGVFVIDEQCIVVFANTSITKLFGYTPKELVGENVRKIMFPEDAKPHDGYVANYLKTGVAKVIGTGRRVIGRKKDGSAVAAHLTVVENKVGSRKAHFIGIMKETTEDVRKTLLESERDIIESLSFPSIIIDPMGVIQGMNQTGLKFFGFRYLEVLARNVSMLMNNDDAKRHDGYLAKYAKTGKGVIIGVGREVIAKKKDGSLFRVNLAIAEKTDGDVTLFVGVFSVIKT